MKVTRKIIKIGNSSGVILPAEILENIGLSKEDEVEIETNGKVIILYPHVKEDPVDKEITEAMERFIRKYRYDLEKLAK